MATPPTLADLRNAIVARLTSLLPSSISVEPHGGVFTQAELDRVALKAPAVRVVVLGARHEGRWKDGRWAVPVHCAAVIVTRDVVADGAKIHRDAGAMILATAVHLAVAGWRFGIEGVQPPEDLELRNEYAAEIDKGGVALWQATWTSTMLLGVPFADSLEVAIAALTQGLVNGVVEWTAAAGPTGDEPTIAEPVGAPTFEPGGPAQGLP